MRSLSSTVSEMPSSWLPSRRVVSKISTDSGSSCGRPATSPSPMHVLVPVLVLVDLAPHGLEVDVLDLAGEGTGIAELAVVDRADGHHLGCGSGQERFVGGVEVRAQDVAHLALDTEVTGD